MIKRGGPIIKIPLLPCGEFPCPTRRRRGIWHALLLLWWPPPSDPSENPTQLRQAPPMIKIPNKKEQGNI